MMQARAVFAAAVMMFFCVAGVQGQTEPGKDIAANREVVRRAFQAFEAGDVNTINAIFASDGPMHGRRETLQGGPFSMLKDACGMCAALSGRTIRIEEMIAEGDRVAVRSRWSGLYTGTIHGVPVKEQKVTVVYTNFYRLSGGRIVENWYLADNMTLAEQLGFSMTAGANASR